MSNVSRARAKRRLAAELAGAAAAASATSAAGAANAADAAEPSNRPGLGAHLGPDERTALLAWFFTERRGQPAPGDADTCAQVLGFESGERLLDALALERRFAERSR